MGGWVGPGDSVSHATLHRAVIAVLCSNMLLQWCPFVTWWTMYNSLESLNGLSSAQKQLVLGGKSSAHHSFDLSRPGTDVHDVVYQVKLPCGQSRLVQKLWIPYCGREQLQSAKSGGSESKVSMGKA